MKSLFWDQCSHLSQSNILQGSCVRQRPEANAVNRGGAAVLRVRAELKGFPINKWIWELDHLNVLGEMEED